MKPVGEIVTANLPARRRAASRPPARALTPLPAMDITDAVELMGVVCELWPSPALSTEGVLMHAQLLVDTGENAVDIRTAIRHLGSYPPRRNDGTPRRPDAQEIGRTVRSLRARALMPLALPSPPLTDDQRAEHLAKLREARAALEGQQ